MNRIEELFKKKQEYILSVFYTAGFPTLNDTGVIAKELEKAGVNLIEIGIPFSDPVADGPVIQESNKIALDNGMNLKLLMQQLKELRKECRLPIILMGYLNPVLQYGVEKFCADAAESGVDGIILPDLPLQVYESEYKPFFEKNNLKIIFLISPTTSEARIKEIDQRTNGFIYAVSASSTTGTKVSFTSEQITYFDKIRSLKLTNPFLIGFGISSRQSFDEACSFSSGAIVGSAFINAIKSTKDLSLAVKNFVNEIRG